MLQANYITETDLISWEGVLKFHFNPCWRVFMSTRPQFIMISKPHVFVSSCFQNIKFTCTHVHMCTLLNIYIFTCKQETTEPKSMIISVLWLFRAYLMRFLAENEGISNIITTFTARNNEVWKQNHMFSCLHVDKSTLFTWFHVFKTTMPHVRTYTCWHNKIVLWNIARLS